MKIEKIAVIGMGMIGGSVAMAAKKNIKGITITGVDPDRKTLAFALKNKIIDNGLTNCNDLKKTNDYDFVVIATPVNIIAKTASTLLSFLNEKTIVTDTGSVKAPIIKWIGKETGGSRNFIGSHPLAGTENSGITAASNNIIAGKKVIITPASDTEKGKLLRLKSFWRALTMKPVLITPEEHDALLALTSHLPHVLAYVLMNTISKAKAGISPLSLTGSGFKDFTRIAKSDSELWTQIILSNRGDLLSAIKKFEEEFTKLKLAIKKADSKLIKEEFQRARQLRRKLK